jgi:hypothetical protein
MDRETFDTADPILDEIAELANVLLMSSELDKLRRLLTKLNKAIGKRYLVGLDFDVTVVDTQQERVLPLLQTGLAGFDQGKPYIAGGDSSPARYIVDGEMSVVPHDHCPRCWEVWDFKFRSTSCSHCGATMGNDVKLLLDTDVCPYCEDGKVSAANPVCDKCGYNVDPATVTWG